MMKKFLLTTLCVVFSALGLSAQVSQTVGPLTVDLESTRVVGDRLLVSGKMIVDRQVRLRNLNSSVVTPDGDVLQRTNILFGGEDVSTSVFDKIFQAGIPYSFDLYFDTRNTPMNPLAALMVEIRDQDAGVNMEMRFSGVPVPMAPDPNLVPGTFELDKDIYLSWTNFHESPDGLKVDFVVVNRASKDQQLSFRTFDNARIIDSGGNIHPGALTLRDRVTFPAGIPVAGSISVEGPVRMSDVLMIQLQSAKIKYSIREIVFRQ